MKIRQKEDSSKKKSSKVEDKESQLKKLAERLNCLKLQLDNKEAFLNQREQELNQKEAWLNERQKTFQSPKIRNQNQSPSGQFDVTMFVSPCVDKIRDSIYDSRYHLKTH